MNSSDQLHMEIERLRRERKALRKQVAALKAAKLRYCPGAGQTVTEKAPFGILVVKAFSILYANQACCDMFGCQAPDQVHNKDVMTYIAPGAWHEAAQLIQNIHHEDLITPLHKEITGRRQDGSEFQLSVTIVNISWNSDPAFLCYLCDIEAKKQHEISIIKSMARRRLLRDMANISIWDWNHDADILEVDEAVLDTLGLTKTRSRSLLSKLLAKIHEQDRRHIRRSIFASLRTGILETAPFRYFDLDGKQHWAELHGQTLSGSNDVSGGMVGILRDVSELCTTNIALSQARFDAESSIAAKQRFISNISHELRTPLNGILGMLQLMQQEVQTEQFQRYLGMATLSGKNLLQIINDILELAEATEPSPPPRSTSFSPFELLVAACESFRSEAEDRKINLHADFQLPANRYYLGDPERLSQVVRNILANSIKFTRQGYIEINAQMILQDEDRHRLLVTVTDTGIGIPDAYQNQIFEPFAQADDSASRKHQGAGLGLGIVRKHIKRLGGTLSMMSEEDVGTSICFTLDLRPSTPPRSTPSHQHPVSTSLKILLAEDNLINQVLAETVLQQMGYDVRPVQNGKEVLKALEEDDFGCILMDIQMPEMSGIEATRRIRGSGTKYAQVPIIALTAHALQSDRERFLECGMTGYLAKPISITELKKAVAKALGRKD